MPLYPQRRDFKNLTGKMRKLGTQVLVGGKARPLTKAAIPVAISHPLRQSCSGTFGGNGSEQVPRTPSEPGPTRASTAQHSVLAW